LDPFADKFMIGTLSLSMLSSGLLPWPIVVLVFGRDVLLVSGTFYHRLKTKAADSAFFDTTDSGAFKVEASMISKVNTALQLAMFGFALTNAAWHVPGDPAMDILL
jgi:cardiolipin synthase (CMP-forming)